MFRMLSRDGVGFCTGEDGRVSTVSAFELCWALLSMPMKFTASWLH
jgi:hypothetical protein